MRKLLTTIYWLALALILPCDVLPCDRLSAAAYAPPVTMSIKTPDGQTQELTAPESGLARLTLKDGREFGFRPTMEDDKGAKVTVTIFKIGSPDTQLGEVETGVAKPAATSKTSPAFTVRITKVEPNASQNAN